MTHGLMSIPLTHIPLTTPPAAFPPRSKILAPFEGSDGWQYIVHGENFPCCVLCVLSRLKNLVGNA